MSRVIAKASHLNRGGDVSAPTHVAKAASFSFPVISSWFMDRPRTPTFTTTFRRRRYADRYAGANRLPIAGTVCVFWMTKCASCPRGSVGQLMLERWLALGYLNAPELPTKFIVDPFAQIPRTQGPALWLYRTGDPCGDETGLLHFLGRTDNQFKVNGYRSSRNTWNCAAAAPPAHRHSRYRLRLGGWR